MTKPPIGIMPKEIWEENRLEALKEAMERRKQVNLPIPLIWVEEYNELLKKVLSS